MNSEAPAPVPVSEQFRLDFGILLSSTKDAELAVQCLRQSLLLEEKPLSLAVLALPVVVLGILAA
ncbi:MAG: hypothetical protein JO170_07790 [Verrucomicrobia bacterium]|nr:hypothetical protein [Verrucomicrobiota bacterium]